MPETFGNFIEMNEKREYLIINFPFTTLPIQYRWRNNGLAADFLADYWETLFPMRDSSFQHVRAEVKDVTRYIANELLENAVKFSYEPSEKPIKIGFYSSDNELRFYSINSINPQSVGQFQQYIQQLLTEDPGKLYFRQLERNTARENSNESRLGLLTILHDYQAQVAWKFDIVQQYPEIIMVTTMAHLKIERF